MSEFPIEALRRALVSERDDEIKLALKFATRLDEIKPAPGDQRHCILVCMEGRIDGLRIAITCLDNAIRIIAPDEQL